MKLFPRRQVMIDQEVQGALIGRVILYWFVCQATVFVGYGTWQFVTLPAGDSVVDILPRLAGLFPALLGSLLLLPWVIADLLRLSNRFVGPIWNLRNAMKRLELGDPVPPLALRGEDFWSDLVVRFNRLCHDRRLSDPRESHGNAAVAFPLIGPAVADGVHDLPVVGATSVEPLSSG